MSANRETYATNRDVGLPKLVTVEVLSQRWTVKRQTLRAWARRGILPALKVGRLVLFDERDIREFLVEARRRPVP